MEVFDGVRPRRTRVAQAVVEDQLATAPDEVRDVSRLVDRWRVGGDQTNVRIVIDRERVVRRIWNGKPKQRQLTRTQANVARGRSRRANVACRDARRLHEPAVERISGQECPVRCNDLLTLRGSWTLGDLLYCGHLCGAQTRGSLCAGALQGLTGRDRAVGPR